MKLVLQSLLALFIVLAAVGLFMLIPTPSELLRETGVIIALLFSPLAIAFYVSMVGVVLVSVWNLISYLFHDKEAENEDIATTKTSQNKKYTYQPKLAETSNLPEKNRSLLLRTLKMSGWIFAASFALAFAFLFYFTHKLSASSHKKISQTYYMKYTPEDFNDSRINNYNTSLIIANVQLINAQNRYEMFEADAKRKIALKCIDVFLKEHNNTSGHALKIFQLGARNYYANTKYMIERSISQERHLKKLEWLFSIPGTDNYGISSPSVGLVKSCKKEISVDQIFKDFMPFYIKNQEYKNQYVTSSARYQPFAEQQQWVTNLRKKFPQD